MPAHSIGNGVQAETRFTQKRILVVLANPPNIRLRRGPNPDRSVYEGIHPLMIAGCPATPEHHSHRLAATEDQTRN
jgi:hypothetical protein